MPIKEHIHVVIHSGSMDNINASKRRGVWASTFRGNDTLEDYFEDAIVYLYFTKFQTGKFYGVAKMAGIPELPEEKGLWDQDGKYGLMFEIHWINANTVIEIPSSVGRYIFDKKNRPVFDIQNNHVRKAHERRELEVKNPREFESLKPYVFDTQIMDEKVGKFLLRNFVKTTKDMDLMEYLGINPMVSFFTPN